MVRLNAPTVFGGRECYRLSSPIATLMRNMKIDSPAMRWFSFILTSTATWIAYCISNTRGLSLKCVITCCSGKKVRLISTETSRRGTK